MADKKYTGMSLTDRLTNAGALDAFSKALLEKNETAALTLLINVEFTHEQASDTVKSLLLDPNSYRNFS
ncbi:MAG: hypothetical protein L3J89_11720 [Gammaproteobacteria bacterium]|nr:hypothetical protein [Gammaproteobacteria bacterium]